MLDYLKAAAQSVDNFIILLKSVTGRFNFQGIYGHEDGKVFKIYGNDSAPKVIAEEMIKEYYKYDSGAKEFKLIKGMKTLHLQTDAVTLLP